MSEKSEKPSHEMQRLIRAIAGKPLAGEKDDQLRARAARRMGISQGRAKTFWYAETENIRSNEMDRARELAFVAPIEEAIDAIERAERHLEAVLDQVRGRIAARRIRNSGAHDFLRGRHQMRTDQAESGIDRRTSHSSALTSPLSAN